jgi:predicted Rossmann fold nucleotide-binding protein DprA/Smf involved in DNA uptake
MTYAVVGCSECTALWVVEGRPETTGCPRCEKRHQFGSLKQFVSTDDEDHAREVRASILANKAGHGDAFADVDNFATLEDYVADAAVDDDEYLEASGVDADEVQAAAERAESSGRSLSKREAVRTALRELEEPTAGEVKAFAAEHGVDGGYVEDALAKFERAGDVVSDGDGYRLL